MSDNKKYSIQTDQLNLWYGDFQALIDVNVNVVDGLITSLIGPIGMWQDNVAPLFQSRKREVRKRHHNGRD